MMRLLCVLVLAGLTAPAMAQDASHKFPLGKPYKVISISGFDVQKAGMTFTLAAEPGSSSLVGTGHAGCNSWTASVTLREDQIEFTNIATTRKMCPKPRMTSEQAFLTTLKSAQRWRIDDKHRLIVEGEAARLLLTAGGADKQSEKKLDKKAANPASKPASR